MCGTVLKAQANMGEANQTCLEACLWRISLCLDAQKFSKDVDVTVPRESAVCIVRKDGTVKQRCVAKFGWGCANGENKKTSSNLSTLPKKQPKS